jgi:aspartate kinase
MSRIIVQKYGGSSVADLPRLQDVARRVVASASSGDRVVVVVSAMGNTTNELLALARAVSPRPGRRELDLLVSVGERVSMSLLAMAIEELGQPAASFTGSQSGIITDERHVAAQVIEVRPHRIQRALAEGKVAIVAGFQGVSREGEVTTLGRGGSDTTAVVLAAALGAEHCEICSDVDGVYSTDPRLVPSARRLEHLPLDAAVALSRAGAKVLLAEAVELARQMGVRLDAAATSQPPGSGTRLPPGPAPAAPIALALDDQLRLLRLPFGAEPPRALEGAGRGAWAEGGAQLLLVDTRNLHGRQLEPPAEDLGPIALLTAVGRALVVEPALRQRALAALPCPPRGLLCLGETLSAALPVESGAEALRRWHAALIGP